jgi:hypothetical protein
LGHWLLGAVQGNWAKASDARAAPRTGQGAPAFRGASGTSQGVSGQLSDGARTRLVTHRLPPLACDLSAQAQPRSRPEGGRRSARHDTTARGVAASRARASRKKGQNYYFFLTHSNGKRRPVAGVGGTKISWGRGEKRIKFSLPPHPHAEPALSLPHETVWGP